MTLTKERGKEAKEEGRKEGSSQPDSPSWGSLKRLPNTFLEKIERLSDGNRRDFAGEIKRGTGRRVDRQTVKGLG